MRKRIKRGISLLLSVAMIASAMPISAVAASAKESNDAISTSENTLTGDSLGFEDGKVATEAEFISALQDSSIKIIELANEITLSRSADGKDNVFVIDRPVTITGGNEGLGGLCLERSGIILGADVTFHNMNLNFMSSVRNAIMANGYNLTIDNVSSVGAFAVDLFCGGITDYNGGNASEIPQTGSGGNIRIRGTNTIGTNIYAGSLSDVGNGIADAPNVYEGNVTIVLEKDSVGFKNIYAHGARENRSGGYPDAWIPNAELYKVSGNVSIQFSNQGEEVNVNGATGGSKNATFIYKGEDNGYVWTPVINNVDSIELLPADNGTMAHLAPVSSQTNFNVLSVPENTRLSLGDMGEEVSAFSFAGGGEIVFTDTSQKMTIGTATGTTKVAVGGVDADGTGSTGNIGVDWTCITVTNPASEYGFVLMPNSNNRNMLLEEDGNGNWITILSETSTRVKEIAVESSFKEDSELEQMVIPVTVEYTTEDENNFLGYIPMSVTVNGEQCFGSSGYMGYEYITGEADTDLVMWFDFSDNEREVNFYIDTYADDVNIPRGRYNISLTIPGAYMEDGQTETISFRVAIAVDELSEQEPLKIEGLPSKITYGETVDFSITGGSGDGAITYTMQGDGEAVITGNKLTATKAGTIMIVAHKAEDEEYKEASSEEVIIEILPAELKLEEVIYTEITEAGKKLKDTELKVKAISLNRETIEGNVYWSDGENTIPETTFIEANTRYTWNFEPSDKNYAVLSGSIIPYCVHQWKQNVTEEDSGITVTISCTEETHIGDLEVQNRHNCEEEKTYSLSYPKNTKKVYYTGERQEASVFSEDFSESSIAYEIWNGNGWTALDKNETLDKAGKYRASVTQLGNTAYIEYEILYLETEEIATAPTEWVTEAVIAAPEGFMISRTIDGEYADSISITEESESETGTIVTYYLKEIETGYITNAKTVVVKVSATGENPNVPNAPDNPNDPDDPNDPEDPDDPNDPEDPDDPNDPEDPSDPNDPENPDNPNNPDEPGEVEVTYTVSFNDIDGSSLYEARTVIQGETIEKPEDPVKDGYKFLGWFEEGSETSYQFDNPVTSNLTLFAKWLEIGDIEEEDQENLTEIQDKIWVAGVEDVRYDGTKHTFDLRVYDGNKLLISGKDYTISYKNNQNAYEYSDEDLKAYEEAYTKDPKTKEAGEFEAAKAPQVILKMKGDYSGTKYIYFRIHPLTIEENCFVQDLSTMYNAKKVQNPKPVVTWNGKTLKNGKDYTFEVTGYPEGMKECKEPGTYIVTITGKGNFAGTDTVKYIIADPENQVAMSKVKVDSIKAVKYSDIPAQGAEPIVTVRDGNDILKLGEDNDYTVTYKNNLKVGTAYAVITGTGTKYVGSKTVSFKITGTPISKIIYDKKILSYEYTGEKIKPFETGFVVKDKETGNVLAAGEHFFVTYSKNVNKGTATMSLKGNEAMGYSGTAKIKFAITAKSVKNLNITFAGGAEGENFKALYMKGGSKPVILVKDGKTVLKEGVDYTISYKNNRKAAKANDGQKAPLVTIQGKGNYKDKDGLNFTIENKALTKENGIAVVAKDKVFKDKANAYHQSFKVYDADGVALSSSDYDAKNAIYEEVVIAEDGSVTVIRTLDKNSKVAQESTIRITVTGKGVYAGGSVSGIYRILKAGYDIGKATIQIQNQLYTGVAVEIISQDQFVKEKVFLKIDQNTKKDLELGKDFEVVEESYKKNIKKGTAKVTFRGKGDFGGEKTVTFKIVQRNVNTNWWKEMAEKVF